MLIRQATPLDCAALAHLQINSYRTAYAGLLPAEYLAAFSYEEQEHDWKDLLQMGEDFLLVADAQDQLIGYALSRQLGDGDRPFDCELIALHVERNYQRRGAGRALLLETARQMRSLGCQSLGLWVIEGNPAVGFYERLGGRRQGEQMIEMDEYNCRFKEIGFVWDRIQDLLEG
jgi:ribosomal protein S18 acetylase RimI-like enzyme